MPYISRLYGTRKNSVPVTSRASTRPVVTTYAAANGKAVLTQLSGRDDTSTWRAFEVVDVSVILAPEQRPEGREQERGGERVTEVLDRRQADPEPGEPGRIVGDQADADHDVVEHGRQHEHEDQRNRRGRDQAPRHAPPARGEHGDGHGGGEEHRVQEQVAHGIRLRARTRRAAWTRFIVR